MALTTNLISYWKLNESSGNAADSVGSNTLVNTNTVGYGAALIANGADFGANNPDKNLSVDSSFGMTTSSDWTVTWWWKAKTDANSGTGANLVMAAELCYGTSGSGNNNRAMVIRDMGAAPGRWTLWNSDFSSNFTEEAVTSDTFYFCTMIKNGSNFLFYVNGVQKATVAVGSTTNLTPRFGFKRQDDPAWVMCKMADESGLWSRVLSGAEMTELINGGAGLTYPFGAAATASSNLTTLNAG